MSNSRNELRVGNTGYTLTVNVYGKDENEPRVLVDLHDSSGTIAETTVVRVKVEEGNNPTLSVVKAEADKTEPATQQEPEPVEPTPEPEDNPEELVPEGE